MSLIPLIANFTNFAQLRLVALISLIPLSCAISANFINFANFANFDNSVFDLLLFFLLKRTNIYKFHVNVLAVTRKTNLPQSAFHIVKTTMKRMSSIFKIIQENVEKRKKRALSPLKKCACRSAANKMCFRDDFCSFLGSKRFKKRLIN